MARRVGRSVESPEPGFFTDGTLWRPVAERLASRGIGSIVPNWPLGSHRVPATGDLSLGSLATAINALAAGLDPAGVVLVGNDTGGALCQLALRDPARNVRGLVLTNCDAFDRFPPRWFVPLIRSARYRPSTWLLLQLTRFRAVRHSPLAYGRLLSSPRPSSTTRDWVDPALRSAAIRRDINRFTCGIKGDELVDAASWLSNFHYPSRVVWATGDRCFTGELGHRLVDALPRAEWIGVDGDTTFVPLQQPDEVAQAIEDCLREIGADTTNRPPTNAPMQDKR
ncbi:MAG: alpha/beta hydrolase [Actinobacteria bacterium]|nr:alpha/beta hydrolase [Actinomycetota bacterium]MCB9389960.1 alpha/beta hydrolase [Acidimicrobiia bacterium]